MAIYQLSNTAAQIDQGVARAYARIGDTGSNAVNFGIINTASGLSSSAFGYDNTASENYSSAFGKSNQTYGEASSAFGTSNTASGQYSSAFGSSNLADGQYSSAFGRINETYGNFSSAIGYNNTASGNYSSAIGFRVRTTVANTQEFGYWSSATGRGSAIRLHGSGYAVTSVPSGDNAPYTDWSGAHGSEPDGTIFRGGLAFKIRTNGQLWVYYNSGGTIKSGSVTSFL